MSATCCRPPGGTQKQSVAGQASTPSPTEDADQNEDNEMDRVSVSAGAVRSVWVWWWGGGHMSQSVIGASPCRRLACVGVGGVLVFRRDALGKKGNV
jgi:hypothetical protein